MAPSRSEQKYREGYIQGQVDQIRNASNSSILGIVIGMIIVALVGFGGWILFRQGSVSEQDAPQPSTSENTDINIDVPTPNIEVPDIEVSAPEIETPDINLPDVNLPEVNVPESEEPASGEQEQSVE